MKSINLNELSLDNFHLWPHFLKYCTLLLSGILLVMLNYELFVSNNLDQYKLLSDETINLKTEFEKKQPLVNLAAYQKQFQLLNKNYQSNLQLLVKENEISNLLNEISDKAVSCGLEVEFFSPKTDEKRSKKQLIINLDLLGEYHKVARFLSNLADFNRLISFDDFELRSAEVESRANNLVRMKISAKIHRYQRENE